MPGSAFARILAHDPDRAKTTLRVLLMAYTEGDLDLRLKEILRVQLARFVEEPYSASLRSQPAQRAGVTEAELDDGSRLDDEAIFATRTMLRLNIGLGSQQLYPDQY